MGNVRRLNYVKVRVLNRNGEIIELEGEEFLVRVFCYEIDYLDGILFVDKIEK